MTNDELPQPATDEQVAECINLIPANCRIVSREGGGPENVFGTLALSVNAMAAEIERLRASIHHAATQLAVAADKRDDAPQSSDAHYREAITGLVMACDKPLESHYRTDVWEEIRLANALELEIRRLWKESAHAMRLLNTTGRYSEGMDCLKAVVGETTYESVASGPAVAAIDAAMQESTDG